MKILALPRDRNPYQELLYEPMRALGADVRYAGEPTRSRTLNQILLPVELTVMRLRGFRRLHIHWLFNFQFAGGGQLPVLAWLSRVWLSVVLSTARVLGYHVVWTAHNVLPHHPIFDDDVAARRLLVRRSNLVIAHGQNALDGLASLGARPAQSVIIPPGPYDLSVFADLPRLAKGRRTVLHFGKIAEYKGVEDLLLAARAPGLDLRVVVAGACEDPALKLRIEQSASFLGADADLILRYIEDDEIGALFAGAHAVVLPFREVTTSSSVLLAMASGRPVVVPRLPAFDHIPDDALIKYGPDAKSLASCLTALVAAPITQLSETGERGRAFSTKTGWGTVATQTMEAMRKA